MSILVLGATGFIGKYFCSNSKHKNLIKTSSKKKKGYVQFNLVKNDIKFLIQKYQIKKVIFFSAISNPDKCEKNIKYSNIVNVIKTKELLNYFIKNKIYFIFFSSEYVFNGNKKNYKEDSNKGTKLLYGKQKIQIENFLKKQRERNFSILRIAKTYGDRLNDKSIFSNFLKSIPQKKFVSCADDQYFSALYVKDLVKVIDLFIMKNVKGLFNVCGDEKLSRYEYVKILKQRLLLDKIQIIPEKLKKLTKNKNLPLNVTMNNNKIKKKINFKFTSYSAFLSKLKKNYLNETKK